MKFMLNDEFFDFLEIIHLTHLQDEKERYILWCKYSKSKEMMEFITKVNQNYMDEKKEVEYSIGCGNGVESGVVVVDDIDVTARHGKLSIWFEVIK